MSMSDQGGINRAGLDYLVYKLSLALHVQFDPYHRGWNDVKQCLKSSKGDLYKCFLSYALLYNVNYGPLGSKEWFQKKQSLARDLINSSSPHEEPFLSFLPWICQERHIPEPQSPEEREQIFQSLIDMNNIRALGPVVKLMRWYSWWESEKYFEGECWATKFIMLWKTKNCSPTNGTNYVKPEESVTIATSGLTDKQELQQLKRKHGTWALAPLLITPASMFQKDLIKILAQPSWSHHASRSRDILTPLQVALFTVEKCRGGWVDELHDLVMTGFLSPSVMKKLYPHRATSDKGKKVRLAIHFDFLAKLVAKRSMSLTAQYLRPPLRYCPMWSSSEEDQAHVLATKRQMQEHWQKILELEKRHIRGEHIPGIDSMHFLRESICRVCFLMNEQDLMNNSSHAQVMMQALIFHLGCTSVIENTHQSAKDTLRQARHNQRSRIHKFKACIDSKILQSRQVNHVSISEIELALGSAQNVPKVLPLTHPNSHQMKKEFQHLMQAKSGSHWWPSTSAQSQFEEAMSFEFLMNHPVNSQTHQLSCLVGEPGSVIADQADGNAFMVLGKATSGYTAWILEIYSEEDASNPGSEIFYFKVVDQKTAIQFRHITSLDGYLEVPVEPTLENENGVLLLQQVGKPVPLAKARLQNGLDLTVKEVKSVLAAYGVTLPGSSAKADFYSKLMEIHASNEDEMAEFMAKSKLKATEDDGAASDFEELLELLEEDLENRNDPDVMQEKAKAKRKRMQHPKAAPEGHITLEPPQRGRGRGRGKGKGRGKGRGKSNPVEGALVQSNTKKHKFGRGKGTKKGKTLPAEASSSNVPTEEEIKAAFSEPAVESQPLCQLELEPPNEPVPVEPVASPSSDFDMESLFATPKKEGPQPSQPLEPEQPGHAETGVSSSAAASQVPAKLPSVEGGPGQPVPNSLPAGVATTDSELLNVPKPGPGASAPPSASQVPSKLASFEVAQGDPEAPAPHSLPAHGIGTADSEPVPKPEPAVSAPPTAIPVPEELASLEVAQGDPGAPAPNSLPAGGVAAAGSFRACAKARGRSKCKGC